MRRAKSPFVLSSFVLALACAPALAGCSGDDSSGDAPLSLDIPAGCNPLASTDACMLPFPSSFATVADATTPTGARVALDAKLLPLRDETFPMDVAPFNTADGFSPVAPILLHFGVDIDVKDLPGIHSLERSVAKDAPIAIIDMETGKRIVFMAEMDANRRSGYDGRYALILRPLEPLAMGHRHAVFVKKGLHDQSGRAIEVPKGFAALRDGTKTDDAALEAARAHYDDIFAFGEKEGYARGDLLLAWDYPVASADYLLGSVTSIRNETLKLVGKTGLPYVITKVTSNPTPEVAKIIEGDFEVPTYLREDDPATKEHEEDTFAYDEAHHPIRQPKNRSYPFTMIVPKMAETSGPLPLAVLGHGIFGTGRSFLEGAGDGEAIQKLCNQYGVVAIATDWIGLSEPDVARIAADVGPNLDRIDIVTDQLQQSLVNTLAMEKLAEGALKDDAQVKVAANPVVDPTHVYYWGASLGGIQGSAFVSISDDISRGVFGVPGAAWASMISRSIVFPKLRAFVEPHYPDPLDFTLGLTLIQARFDHADPANLTKMMFERPLPDASKNRLVILQEAIGDSQVPNMTTELLARGMGVKLMTPSNDEPFGLEKVGSPSSDSVLAQYRLADWDKPEPPESNVPPNEDNGVHHEMNLLPNVHQQIAKLWFEGQVEQFCTESCDPD